MGLVVMPPAHTNEVGKYIVASSPTAVNVVDIKPFYASVSEDEPREARPISAAGLLYRPWVDDPTGLVASFAGAVSIAGNVGTIVPRPIAAEVLLRQASTISSQAGCRLVNGIS